MRLPSLELAAAINRIAREDDEWFDEPDELERLQRALDTIDGIDYPLTALLHLEGARAASAPGLSDERRGLLLLA